jgi:MerR HTH family regulatory protein
LFDVFILHGGMMTIVSIDSPALAVPARRTVGRLVVPPKRYKVGELVTATGLSRQTLHNYTKWGLIGEVSWTAGGHRLYDESVFARLERVMQLKANHTVEKVRELLEREAKEQAA